MRVAPSSIMPVANRRWITRSCRSRAIRSRSSNTASRSRSRRSKPKDKAIATCVAKASASSTTSPLKGSSPANRYTPRAPMAWSRAISGNIMAGPNRSGSTSPIRASAPTNDRPSSWASA